MGDIQFNDGTQEFGPPPSTQHTGSTDLTGKIVTWGLASSRQQAQTILIVVLVVALLGIAYFMFFTGDSEVPSTPVYN